MHLPSSFSLCVSGLGSASISEPSPPRRRSGAARGRSVEIRPAPAANVTLAPPLSAAAGPNRQRAHATQSTAFMLVWRAQSSPGERGPLLSREATAGRFSVRFWGFFSVTNLAPNVAKMRCSAARTPHILAVLGLAVGCCCGGDIGDSIGSAQKAAVKQKMAADEAAINPKTLGAMLQDGFSIPAILSAITKEHGIGACCQAALVVGSASGSHELETMLRQDPQDYSSDKGGVEGTVSMLASRAGTCCRGSLCTSLRSAKQCDWLGTCRWHPSRTAAADGRTGLCKEVTTAQLLAPSGGTAVERTRDYMKQELKEKEKELKESDLKLAQEEEELSAEKEISRLTAEARSLFKQGRFSEAKLYLEEAVRLDSSKTVQHIPGTSRDPSHRHGLLDLQTAASILDALR